jgi:hypothetical protein
MFVEHPARGAEALSDACDRFRTMHAHLIDRYVQCGYELAWLAEERGDMAKVTSVLAGIEARKLPESRLAAGFRDLAAGNHAQVVTTMTAHADELAAGKFWPKWRSVDAHLLVAVAADKLGDRATAVAQAERALATIDELGDFAKSTFVQRRRGRVLAMLAMLGVEKHREAALAWAQLAGGYEQRIAELSSGR